MKKNDEKLVSKFQVTELEQRLEMAKWSLSVKGNASQKNGASLEVGAAVVF